jgi:hypothetical protein
MAQRSGCAALALAQVRIRDRQELDFVGNCTCTYCTYTWLALVLYPYCTRTLCSCHATRYWSPPTKAAHSSSQPRASPDSCHPDTFSMKINKDPKDARFGTKGSSAFLLPRGKNRKGEDGTVQLSRWAMGEGDGRRACLSGILRTVQ